MASNAAVFGELPPSSLFTFPPSSDPAVIPPPLPGSIAYSPPFEIPDHLYAAALDPRVPLTIAALYAVTVKALNAYNTKNGKKPWPMSRTRPFFAFVVLHNVFLAAYSAWTFWGMLGGMMRSVVSPAGAHGLAATVDSVCQLNGPSGLGHAAIFNETIGRWTTAHASAVLGDAGLPGRDVPGRIWNEGLAFYGWIFYLSKFYEVLDTFIILAKGKLSSTLQTYHHAGAMMCMWAGMRYMSAPIWMFVLVNSGIHAMMYTYYTLTAFSIRVPTPIKRTLTSLQITQFVVGASYAMAHSFISYTVPVTITVDQPIPQTGSEAPVAAAAAGVLDNIKNLLFGAATAASAAATAAPPAAPRTTTLTHTVHVSQPCITTTGETFAIWLNVLYLAPLTYLFVKFFITSYLRRSSAVAAKARGKGAARRYSNVSLLAEKAGWDAAKATQREVYGEDEGACDRGSSPDEPSPGGSARGSPVRRATRARPNGKANGAAAH